MSDLRIGEGRRVLVVDDDPVIRIAARASLQALGFRVEEAENGLEALSCIDRSPPDLVVMDVEMPELDGFSACEQLRRREQGAGIPVLVTTGHTDQGTIDRAFQVGATDFISKPIDWQLLQHRVRFMMRATEAFSDLKSTLTRLSQSESRLARTQHLARIGHWEWMIDDRTLLTSSELQHIVEWEPGSDDSLDLEWLCEVTHPEDREQLEKAIRDATTQAQGWDFDHRIATRSGKERIVHHQAEVILGSDGRPDRIAGAVQDITDRKRVEERIRFLAHYDILTALPNRTLLREHLTRLLGSSSRSSNEIAVLSLNVDRFKRVNETFGHTVGDELLCAVSDRLAQSVRSSDFVGSSSLLSRSGGDEFTVVLSGLGSVENAALVCRRLLESMVQPFVIREHELTMTASIGAAIHPDDGQDADTLMRNADTALHHAKRRGSGCYEFFSEAMNREVTRKLHLEGELRRAIESGGLALSYQPQFFTHDSRPRGFEVLARWPAPEPVAPDEFIKLAEETGLIDQLGEWVLRESCRQIKAWQEAGYGHYRFAVNVSSVQIRNQGLADLVEQVLNDYELEARYLELEVTESALISDEPQALATIRRLKALGIQVALDDFGTGFSSLSHLVRFPIDIIKIDQSFVRRIGRDGKGDAIVSALSALARELGMKVCAEGVETAEQVAFLARQGCDVLQGFLLARPMDAAATEDWLRAMQG